MKDKLISLTKSSIDGFHVFVDDCFIDIQEGKKVFNIVIDSDEIIDLNKITDVSRVINKIIDEKLDLDVDYVDIYSKEKGDSNNE